MRDTIKLLVAQVHSILPDVKISITRFNEEYKHGQVYIGELDTDIEKELMHWQFVKRNFVVIYSQNPVGDQESNRQEFERIHNVFRDNVCHFEPPQWHMPYFDSYNMVLTLQFQIWERYRWFGGEWHILGSADLEYPRMEHYEPDIPDEPTDPDIPDEPAIVFPEGEFITGYSVIGEGKEGYPPEGLKIEMLSTGLLGDIAFEPPIPLTAAMPYEFGIMEV